METGLLAMLAHQAKSLARGAPLAPSQSMMALIWPSVAKMLAGEKSPCANRGSLPRSKTSFARASDSQSLSLLGAVVPGE